MNTNTPTKLRPPLETLACVNERCELYGQVGQPNLRVRKTYGQDGLRYLRCGLCGAEFSERKNTALWNTKVAEAKAVSVPKEPSGKLRALSRSALPDSSDAGPCANRQAA